MNSEPSGTDADIPDGESAIDVYILCKDAPDSEELSSQLTPQGYRVTLFSDSTDLLEALRAGKPNLLICDATGPGLDGYDVCRDIKADDDLWRVPVLLLTGVASLGDLLVVLDSNADNFIARPYDPQYLLSLIETILVSPVEKPDPEKVRTQFKIRHEDRDYVIMADRRKLLEFLLSSFEIAVDRAGELAQVQGALENLKSTLERRIADRTHELNTETARLQMLVNGKTRELESAGKALDGQKKEGDALRSRLEQSENAIAAHRDEITRLTQEIESTRARLVETEDTARTLGTEKDELEQALRGDAESLNRDLGQTRKDLEEIKKELSEVSGLRAALEMQVAALTHTHDESQKALGARSIEIEQLKSALASDKNRAEAAELEVKSILQEKARSEQELRQMVGDITEKAKQQSQESLRLADELAAEKERRTAADQRCSALAQEIAKKEAAFAAEKGTFMEHHEALQQKYDMLTESSGAERQKSESREADLARITEAKEQADREILALKDKLATAVAATEEERLLREGAEKNAAETARTKDAEVQALNNDLCTLRGELEGTRSGLMQARNEREATLAREKSLRDDLAAAVLAGAEADKLARSAASETEQVREELETERRLHHAAEDKLTEATRAKETAELHLGATGEQAVTQERELLAKIQGLAEALDTERDTRSRAEDELARVTREKEAVDQKILAITDERTAERASGDQSAARERELLAKVQDLTNTIDAERDAQSRDKDELTRVTREKEVTDQRLQAFAEERTAEDARRKDYLAELEADLQTAIERQRSLEEQLRAAEREQAEKEAALQALAKEIERATAALDAEKEERHATEEAYAEAKDALVALRKKPQIPSTAIEEIPIENHTIVAKEPDLPVMIRNGPQALARKEIDRMVPVQPVTADPETMVEADSPHARIRSVEDLFEDPREINVDELPDATQGPGAPGVGEDIPGDMEQEESEADDETGDADAGATDDEVTTGGVPTFSREQWFDLVKWAHNTGSLSHEDRIRIVKLGRLIQKGRKLTRRQESQLADLMTLAHAQGYRPHE